MNECDVVIIGCGPAGLTAGLYCGRAKLSTTILEKNTLGGQVPNIDRLENWLGAVEGIPGAELAGNALEQVMQYEVGFESQADVKKISILENQKKEITTTEDKYLAKAVIIAGGTRPKKINLRGYDEHVKKAIHFCVMCDGAAYAGKDIVIIGGGDSGLSGALYMNRLGCKITVVEAMNCLNASMILRERVKNIDNIEILCSTVAESINDISDNKKLLVLNKTTNNEKRNINIDALFILAGREAETDYLKDLVELDDNGFIRVNNKMETNRAGIFAAGDIRSQSVMQVIAASGDGATAAIAAIRYVNANRW
jgi:thioredoxin reductase (NADPH)